MPGLWMENEREIQIHLDIPEEFKYKPRSPAEVEEMRRHRRQILKAYALTQRIIKIIEKTTCGLRRVRLLLNSLTKFKRR